MTTKERILKVLESGERETGSIMRCLNAFSYKEEQAVWKAIIQLKTEGKIQFVPFNTFRRVYNPFDDSPEYHEGFV